MKRIPLFAFMLILISVWTMPVLATSLTDAQKQKSSVDSKLNSVNKQKQQTQSKLKSVKTQKAQLDSQKKQQDADYQKALTEASNLTKSIKPVDDAISSAEEKYNRQKELLKTRLKVMYENSNNSYIQTLLESKDINDFLNKLELISAVANNDKQVIEDVTAAKKDLEFKKASLEEQKQQKQKEANAKLSTLNTLNASRSDVDAQIRKLNSTLDQLNKQEDDLLKQSQELNDTIRSLQKGGTKYAGGSMRWPIPSSHRISSYFGNRIHPILHTYKMHTGLDISASSGVSIIAANKGTVIVAGWQNGYGYTVVIDHGGGISTLYAHCSKLLVKVGQKVSAGQTIAKVGSTGLSTGPHCHFEVRKNGSPVNPLAGYVSP